MIYAREQGRAAHQILILAADLTRERESLRASLVESQRILALRNFDRAQTAFEKDQVALGLHWMLASWRSANPCAIPAPSRPIEGLQRSIEPRAALCLGFKIGGARADKITFS